MATEVDVAVIGSGVTAIEIASRVRERGGRVAIVGAGAGESAHAQGVIHQGYAYARKDPRLVREMWAAASLWDEQGSFYYGFRSIDTRERWQNAWTSSGLDADTSIAAASNHHVLPGEVPGGLFKSSEKCIRPSRILSRLSQLSQPHPGLPEAMFFHGEVDEYVEGGDFPISLTVRRKAAPPVNLGCQYLVRAVGRSKYRVTDRSLMLVANGKLPNIDLCIPDFAAADIPLSLYMCTHIGELGDNTWLIQSSGLTRRAGTGQVTGHEIATRAEAIKSDLESLISDSGMADAKWGYYTANITSFDPPHRPLRDRCFVPSAERVFDAYSDRLTLAPSVAGLVLEALPSRFSGGGSTPQTKTKGDSILPIAEKWCEVPLADWATLTSLLLKVKL